MESNIRIFVDQLLIGKTASELSLGHKQRKATWLYQKPKPPPYIYHKATSAYSAAVQLYARSGQLATAEKMEEGMGNGCRCRLGCADIEDEHHIFVICLHFDGWRLQAGEQLGKIVSERLSKLDLVEEYKNEILSKAMSFYIDEPTLWPLKESRFYLGHVPKLFKLFPTQCDGHTRLQMERVIHAIYCEWHNASVRLAARIFGEFQRRVTRSWDEERKGGK